MSTGISVILPVYDGARFLAEAIGSVLAQTLPPDEIIVVDDGSSDGSARIAAGLAGAARVPIRCRRQPNRGPAAARNAGLALARGDILGFQDADDLWAPDRLAVQHALLLRHPGAGMVFGRTRFMYAEDSPRTPGPGEPVDRLAPHWFTGIHCGLYRRTAFALAGPFNETLRYYEDVDWFRRARAAGVAVVAHDDVVLLHRRHGGNMTNDLAAMRRAWLPMLRLGLKAGQPADDASLLDWLTARGHHPA